MRGLATVSIDGEAAVRIEGKAFTVSHSFLELRVQVSAGRYWVQA